MEVSIEQDTGIVKQFGTNLGEAEGVTIITVTPEDEEVIKDILSEGTKLAVLNDQGEFEAQDKPMILDILPVRYTEQQLIDLWASNKDQWVALICKVFDGKIVVPDDGIILP